MPVTRWKTLSITLMEQGVDVFALLERYNVDLEDVEAVQMLPGQKADVTFKTEIAMEGARNRMNGDQRLICIPYESRVKIVTILHVAHEVPDDEVKFILARYGDVKASRRLVYKDHPTIFNGSRQYRMEVNQNIPSTITLGGRSCWVRYSGQRRTCHRCGQIGHESKECTEIKCFKCLEMGHVARECPNLAVCSICLESGHRAHSCPKSFANRCKPTKEWEKVAPEEEKEGEKDADADADAEAGKEEPAVEKQIETERPEPERLEPAWRRTEKAAAGKIKSVDKDAKLTEPKPAGKSGDNAAKCSERDPGAAKRAGTAGGRPESEDGRPVAVGRGPGGQLEVVGVAGGGSEEEMDMASTAESLFEPVLDWASDSEPVIGHEREYDSSLPWATVKKRKTTR